MRIRIFIIFILISTSLYSQEFSFEMIFMDAIGNSDTIIMGYDENATDSVDLVFNEINIVDTPLNPVFDETDLSRGVHINGIGSYRPDMREISSETIQSAKVFVDSCDACLVEAGDIVIPLKEGVIDKNHIQAEIGASAVQFDRNSTGTAFYPYRRIRSRGSADFNG